MGTLIGKYVCEFCGNVIKWQAHKADRYRERGLYPVFTSSEELVLAEVKTPNTEEVNIELELICPYCNHIVRFLYNNGIDQ